MSVTCDSEISVQNENALHFSVFTKPAPVLEYIKTISSLIGASHILAVFEENDTIKVFFDEKRYVDILISSCIHVMGHHIYIDYVVPPGTKVVLTNVDPVISNFDLRRLLSIYGKIVSPIIRPPISDDAEFCHIGYGVRHVYMVLNGTIPSKLEFKYGDQFCAIKIKMDCDLVPFIKSDDFDVDDNYQHTNVNVCDSTAGPSNVDSLCTTDRDPVVVNVESIVSKVDSKIQISSDSFPKEKESVKCSVDRLPKSLRIRKRGITPTSRAAKKIRQNVKLRRANKIKQIKRKRGRAKKIVNIPSPFVIRPLSSSSEEEDSSSPTIISNNKEVPFKCPHNSILNEEELHMFLEEVKHQRAPLELAKKYLGNDCTNDSITRLIQLLNDYMAYHNSQNIKLRIGRLISKLLNTTS